MNQAKPDKALMYRRQEPWVVNVERNQTVQICQCGKTTTAPYCDQQTGSNNCEPYSHAAKQAQILLVCGCKRSQQMPFCDGSHNKHPNNTPGRLFKEFIRNPFK